MVTDQQIESEKNILNKIIENLLDKTSLHDSSRDLEWFIVRHNALIAEQRNRRNKAAERILGVEQAVRVHDYEKAIKLLEQILAEPIACL